MDKQAKTSKPWTKNYFNGIGKRLIRLLPPGLASPWNRPDADDITTTKRSLKPVGMQGAHQIESKTINTMYND